MKVRLIASDLDGTLFGSDHVPEPRTVAAVNALVDTGVVFAAVTGRSYFGGAERVTGAGVNADWFIGSNGGHRLNLQTNTLEERLVFSEAQITEIQAALSRELGDVGVSFEHTSGFSYNAAFVRTFPLTFDGQPRTNSAVPFASNDIGKIFVTHPDLTNHELIAATKPVVPAGTQVTTSGISFVEFTPEGADKGSALARLCELLSIGADEVIAFGDNDNDLTMLDWAGRGIAMANASANVLAAGHETTGTNSDFGVAAILEALVS